MFIREGEEFGLSSLPWAAAQIEVTAKVEKGPELESDTNRSMFHVLNSGSSDSGLEGHHLSSKHIELSSTPYRKL